MTPFGVLIREARLEINCRLRDVAARAELSLPELRAIEQGALPPPDPQTVACLADYLGLDRDALEQAAHRGRRGLVAPALRYRWRMRLYPLCERCNDHIERCAHCGPLYIAGGPLEDAAICPNCASPICAPGACESDDDGYHR